MYELNKLLIMVNLILFQEMSQNKDIKEAEEDEETKFHKLNIEYQKCLNTYYDKFFEGNDEGIDFNHICTDVLDKMKSSSLYKSMINEYQSFINSKGKL